MTVAASQKTTGGGRSGSSKWTSASEDHLATAATQQPAAPDSAFGSCELDDVPSSTEAQHRGQYATLLRSSASALQEEQQYTLARFIVPPVVKVEQFTKKEKAAWLAKGADRGFIRLFEPDALLKRSLVVPCQESTTVAQICAKIGVGVDSLHVQRGGTWTRRLQPEDRPLSLQCAYLASIGVSDKRKQQTMGDCLSLGYAIRFYTGACSAADDMSSVQSSSQCQSQQLSASALVRKGGLFQQWTRRLCIFDSAKLIIYPTLDRLGEPEVIPLSRAKVQASRVRPYGRCLRVNYYNASKRHMSVLTVVFDTEKELALWLSSSTRVCASAPLQTDLSSQQLQLLPDHLFDMANERMITALNLRHNALRERPRNQPLCANFGWLDDLTRFRSLRSLNLSDNELSRVPPCLLQLHALTELVLASNRITQLPAEINRLKNLSTLNLCNNYISWLPLSLAECHNLTGVDLSFNRLSVLPEVLKRMARVQHWQLAGNALAALADNVVDNVQHVNKLDLRRNQIGQVLLSIGSFACLTQLVLSDNRTLDEFDLDLCNLQSLQTLHADRCGLASLALNGCNATHISARYNRLSQLHIHPVPHRLRSLDVAHNRLHSLPEWLAELGALERLLVNHNKITQLPRFLLCHAHALRVLQASHNLLAALPDQIESCNVELLNVNHNKLTELPLQLLCSMHRLREFSAAQNFLTWLPPLNGFVDLNKVQTLVLSANYLTDPVLPAITGYRRLKVLDLAYNRICNVPDGLGCTECSMGLQNVFEQLTCLQRVNLSGNRISRLPSCLASLPNLHILAAHSNCIKSVDNLQHLVSVRVLDLSNNCLESVQLATLAANLKHLDLSCNPALQLQHNMPEQTLDREVSIVRMTESDSGRSSDGTDTSGEWPTVASSSSSSAQCWSVGFAETSGDRNKLCVQQVRRARLPSGHADTTHESSLYAIVDGGLNRHVSAAVHDALAQAIGREARRQSLPPTRDRSYLKYGLLDVHLGLEAMGQKLGASAAVVHLLQTGEGQCALNVANVGHVQVVLCRRGRPLVLTQKHTMNDSQPGWQHEYERLRRAHAILTENNEIQGESLCSRQLGRSYAYPIVIPQPHVQHIDLLPNDEFVIVANDGLWQVMTHTEAVRRVRPISNPVLAAKHLQDMAQSYGHNENLSIIVIRLYLSGPEPPASDCAMRALRVGQAYSAIDILATTAAQIGCDSDNEDAQSEPQGGRALHSPPNYYFEYKKKLKMAEAEEEDEDDVDGLGDPELDCLNAPADCSNRANIVDLDEVPLPSPPPLEPPPAFHDEGATGRQRFEMARKMLLHKMLTGQIRHKPAS